MPLFTTAPHVIVAFGPFAVRGHRIHVHDLAFLAKLQVRLAWK